MFEADQFGKDRMLLIMLLIDEMGLVRSMERKWFVAAVFILTRVLILLINAAMPLPRNWSGIRLRISILQTSPIQSEMEEQPA
jgi:hypothetical protein